MKNENQEGIIRVHPRGFGFVIPEEGEDIFIPKSSLSGAVDGDRVKVEINLKAVSEKGPEGRVLEVIKRGRVELAGTVEKRLSENDYAVHVPLVGASKKVIAQKSPFKLQVGDRIIMDIVDWGEDEIWCHPKKHLGNITDPSIDNACALAEFELRSEFSPNVIKEAKRWGREVTADELVGREDFRDQETFTIDPDTAKDFDDALSLSVDEEGHYHLGIHIADVSHYVTPFSALDKEARLRCNSTYFPNFCLPMLPHELSSHLCSLMEKVDRLTVSVLVEFDKNGHVIEYRIARSVIQSKKRFTYKEAKEILDGKKKSKHEKTLKTMQELCLLLKKRRFERGSVEFSLPEVSLKVDEQGMPIDTETIYYDITHQLVEEFMLKANELVALHISNLGRNLTYRIHDIPSEENMKDFSLLAEAFGFKLPPKPKPGDLQRLFSESEDSPHAPYLATSYIRRMKLALYSPDNIGHYGLALTHYCHFTSPIRRYVDLVAHRILLGESDERKHLELIAESCSEQERISAKAEMSVLTLKKLRWAAAKKKENPRKTYEAVITKVKPFGIAFEVIELMLDGFIHVSQVGTDYYRWDEASQRLIGDKSRRGYALGDKIDVMLKQVDLIHKEAEWQIV